MARVVAVACPKGGGGKTTVSVNLGAALASKGFSTLILGVDPQCGLASSFGRDPLSIDRGLPEFFEPEGRVDLSVQPTGIGNLDFVSSNVWSWDEEDQLLGWAAINPESLREKLLALKEGYDFCLLDCPPNLGPLTVAALQSADTLLVPLQAEELAYRSLPRLFDALAGLEQQGFSVPELEGVLLNQVDLRTRMSNSVLQRAQEDFPGKVFRTLIPRSIRLAEVAQRGKPVMSFNRSGGAAQAFLQVADEILDHILAEKDEGQEEHRAEVPGVGDALPADIEALLAGEENPDESGEGEVLLSLEEIPESEQESCQVSRPSLDDYEGSEETPWH